MIDYQRNNNLYSNSRFGTVDGYSANKDIFDFSFILHLNKIIENEKKLMNIFKEGTDYKSRKALIDNMIIEFIDKDLNLLNECLFLVQNLFDFIVYIT